MISKKNHGQKILIPEMLKLANKFDYACSLDFSNQFLQWNGLKPFSETPYLGIY